jgi:hypothetical protein
MPEFRPFNDPPLLDLAAYRHCIRDKVLVGLVLFTLVRTGEALAGDQASIGNAALNRDFGDFRRSSPPTPALITAPEFTAPELIAPVAGDSQAFSTTEFRPRKHSVLDADPAANSFGDAPMLRGTTVWQRLSEYRARDRVRVLTLWESGGSTVSLQAGKGGSPSLQWTSGAMIHGAATRGLLDRLFAVSLASAGNRLRRPDRPASAPTPPNQGNVPVVASVK